MLRHIIDMCAHGCDFELWPMPAVPCLLSWMWGCSTAGLKQPFWCQRMSFVRAIHTMSSRVSKSFPMLSFVLWPHCCVCLLYGRQACSLFWILSRDEQNCYEHTPASFGSHVCLFFSRNAYKRWSCESLIINTAKCFSMKVYYVMCHLQPRTAVCSEFLPTLAILSL